MNIILKTEHFTILLNVREVSRDVKGDYHVPEGGRYQYILKRTNEPKWLEAVSHSINSEAFAQIMLRYTKWAVADAEQRGLQRAVDALTMRKAKAVADSHETSAMVLQCAIVVVQREMARVA